MFHCQLLASSVMSPQKKASKGLCETTEDSRFWSRHTKSARWVCGEVLGV